MKILFASQNAHKAAEYKSLLPAKVTLITLDDIQWKEEIPEPFHTFKENSLAKAMYVFRKTNIPCFADDSGLEVKALDGRPGVLSALYAGTHGDSQKNMEKLMIEMEGIRDRSARFIAVISYIDPEGIAHYFEGHLDGDIAFEKTGTKGFGYDPVFIPHGYDNTLGELEPNLTSLHPGSR